MQSSQLANLFKALAAPVRVRILEALIKSGEPITSSRLADCLGLDRHHASHHLMKMAGIGLIRRHTSGRYALYEEDRDILDKMKMFLDKGECL